MPADNEPHDALREALDGVLVAIARRGLAPEVGQALNPLCEAVDALEGRQLVNEGEAVIDGEVVSVVRWSNSLLQINRLKESSD